MDKRERELIVCGWILAAHVIEQNSEVAWQMIEDVAQTWQIDLNASATLDDCQQEIHEAMIAKHPDWKEAADELMRAHGMKPRHSRHN